MADPRPEAQERTEQATPKRLQEAREHGEIARSRELSTVSVLLVAAVGLALLGPQLLFDLSELMRRSLSLPPIRFAAELPVVGHLMAALIGALKSLAPLLALLCATAFLGPMALGGWIFSTRRLSPQWDKLDPIKGFKRLFAWHGLMELVKALGKFVLLTVVAALLLWQMSDRILTINAAPLRSALSQLSDLLMWTFLALCAALLVIAAVDVPFQIWNHARQLRMSRQELRDELKEAEGKPELRSRIRELQRAMARHRMIEAVPKADVVITNPQHYAVALRYQPGTAKAPRVVAKGSDWIAMRIQGIARRHGVPVVRSPALARAVYFSTRLDQEIPAGLYFAVAQIFAYVYALRQHPAGHTQDVPPPPVDLPIPEELMRDED